MTLSAAISKEEFLGATDLILSAAYKQDNCPTCHNKAEETVFGGEECQRVASLALRRHKSNLAKLVDMLSAKHLAESTDEELLDMEYSLPPSPSPPPVPPRNESICQDSMSPPIPMRKVGRLRGSSSSTPSEHANTLGASASTSGEHPAVAQSEPDSDSDFEPFIPPLRRKCSDFELFTPPMHPKKRRTHSRLKHRAKSFSVPTSQAKTKVKGRSKSLDRIIPHLFTAVVDPDEVTDYTGDSAGYSFEHINAWRKVTRDTSFITGSLPELDNENDLEDSYIDPNEIAAVFFDTGTKLGTHASTRLRSRVLSLASFSGDNPYLTVINGGVKSAASPASAAVGSVPPITPYTSIDGILRKTFTFPETLPDVPSRSVTPSGYQSDASSDADADDGLQQDAKRSSLYARIPGDFLQDGIENVAYSRSQPSRSMPSKGSGLYASIEELDHTISQQVSSSLVPNGVRGNEPRLHFSPSQGLMQYDGYCVVQNNFGAVCPAESPPSLPPRRRYSSLSRQHSLSDGEMPMSGPQLLKPLGVSIAGCRYTASTQGAFYVGAVIPFSAWHVGSSLLSPTQIGPLPLYTTLRGVSH